jgi:hypothetical protein
VKPSKGVLWTKQRGKWKVVFWFNGKRRHLGYYDLDDHTKAVAEYSTHARMTNDELKVRFNSQ